MVRPPELILELPVADGLGEGISWDERSDEFIWTDIPGRRLHRFDLTSGTLHSLALDGRLCSFALTSDPAILLAAFEREVGWLEKTSGRFRKLAGIDVPEGARLNDGRAGPDGAFWVGSMVEDAARAGTGDAGQLYRVAPDGRVESCIEGICISNGLAWSLDGRTLYHSDSGRAEIRAYPFDPALGRIGPAIAEVSVELGEPDGAAVDASGRYLTALWGRGAITAFAADLGSQEFLEVPACQPTCVAFGGKDLDLLAVTTARAGLSEEQLAREPGAGSMFIFRVPFKGRLPFRFAGMPYNF